METIANALPATRKLSSMQKLHDAIKILNYSRTGRQVIIDLHTLLSGKGSNLDFAGQQAVLDILNAMFNGLASTTLETLRENIDPKLPNSQKDAERLTKLERICGTTDVNTVAALFGDANWTDIRQAIDNIPN